jgi:REP element-mobilizing transposase RayT
LGLLETLRRKCAEARTAAFGGADSAYGWRTCPARFASRAEDAVYHLIGRGNSRRPIFLDDHDRNRFLVLLGFVVDRYRWHCYGFCLMTTHYHLLVMTPEPNLARGMQWLNAAVLELFGDSQEVARKRLVAFVEGP